jgi:hypothetical protein
VRGGLDPPEPAADTPSATAAAPPGTASLAG